MVENPVTSVVWLVSSLFVPTFICAALLRANGARGMLALTGLVAIAAYLFSDYEGWQLGIGTISALLGLALGGSLSDKLEYSRVTRKAEADKARNRREKGLV